MKTSIIILSMNQQEYSRRCLESVRAHTREHDYEIVWVDNGSTDGTAAWLSTTDVERPLFNPRNRGFAGGCNQGLRAASGDLLVLLNNDIIVTADWLAGLHEVMASGPRLGLVGPCTNYISGPQCIAEARARYGDDLGAGLQTYAREFRAARRGQWPRAERLVGFCLGLTRALYVDLGPLDERFGGCGSFEDDDYCLRALEAGYEARIAGDVFVHHFGHVTLDAPENRLDKQAQSRINARLFEEKWGPEILAKYRWTLYQPRDEV